MHRRDLMKAAFLSPALSATRAGAVSPPVVLELFTSQGCSSCPPADALLGELVRTPGNIGLAWHVDYWNSLGWRDPYARPEWTERQKIYATRLRAEVYTPALVVNGAEMLVGSDQSAVRRAIGQAAPPALAVALRRTSTGLSADIGVSSVPVTGMLVAYDPRQTTEIAGGENGGRRLMEYRVVREVTRLATLAPRIELPSVAPGRGAVLLVQDLALRVVGVADLPPPAGA